MFGAWQGRATQKHAVRDIKPIESLTTKTGVRELCAMLATGQISQRAAQAAAWNLNNNIKLGSIDFEAVSLC